MNVEKKARAMRGITEVLVSQELSYPEMIEVLGDATVAASQALQVAYDLKRKSPEDFASSLCDTLKEMFHG